MAFPLYVYLDTELGVMHASSSCAGAKIPSKYGYLETRTVRNIGEARVLDLEYRACESCQEKLGIGPEKAPKRAYAFRQKKKGENQD